jgi:hypothetical protein
MMFPYLKIDRAKYGDDVCAFTVTDRLFFEVNLKAYIFRPSNTTILLVISPNYTVYLSSNYAKSHLDASKVSDNVSWSNHSSVNSSLTDSTVIE